ncbi:hypothetical protein [Marinobacter sp. 1_MG-2023]|uniref:hypothetical protein n=1 Tax=Marinobacter sp. 1_MG-2023 TaxID=3062627 RepID=UPI0026E4256C|nr:hypothetical protein [Marinobacter sp. 1_MG-2023]MDO6823302.1 hypothetical protein [Marinobacter sp. 1_MG-2023]
MIPEFAYFFSLSCAFFYVFVKKRQLDLFSVSAICAFLYSYPLFFGVIYDPGANSYVKISDVIYYFYSVFFILLVGFAVIFDFLYKKIKIRMGRNLHCAPKTMLGIMLVFSCVLFFMVLVFGLDDLLKDGKSGLVSLGILFTVFSWSVLTFFSYAQFSGIKHYSLFAFLLIFFLLFVGSRSYFATSLIIFVLVYFKDKDSFRLVMNIKLLFFGFSLVVFLVFYKVLYQDIFSLDFSGALSKSSNLSILAYRVLDGSESTLIMSNFNNSIHGFEKNGSNDYYFLGLFFRLFPFFSDYISSFFGYELSRYSSVIMKEFYPGVSYGMGASFWGEAIYGGGFLGLALFLMFYFVLVFLGSWVIVVRAPDFLKSFLLVPFSYVAFYIHRIEFSFVIYVFCICIFLMCFYFFVYLFLKRGVYEGG